MDFNPFNKPLPDITAHDLAVLSDVSEGWYVEYKRDLPNQKAVAKSIAAFANHYGGWVFYGIAESTSGPAVAAEFVGIPRHDIRLVLQNIRAAATHHINPAPHFEIRVLEGPADEIGLAPDRAVVAVRVPHGAHAPYVHSSGRIYRRVADSAEPIVETQRSAIDFLFERSRRANQRLVDFYSATPRLSTAEEHLTYLHLFLMTDPWHEHNHRGPDSFDTFIQIMRTADRKHGGIPFDNCYPSHSGFVARQARHNDPALQVLTWVHFADNAVRVSIPLNVRTDSVFLEHAAERYMHGSAFLMEVMRQGHTSPEIIDTNNLVFLVAGCIGKYVALCERLGLSADIYAKAHVRQAWRRVPFLDADMYLKKVRDYGVPVIQDDAMFVPADVHGPTLAQLTIHKDDEEPFAGNLITALPIVVPLLEAFGIPAHLLASPDGEMFDAAQRSLIGAHPWE